MQPTKENRSGVDPSRRRSDQDGHPEHKPSQAQVREAGQSTPLSPGPAHNPYRSTCWIAQRFTSRSLANSCWLIPFNRSPWMHSRRRLLRMGFRPGIRPSARAFAGISAERASEYWGIAAWRRPCFPRLMPLVKLPNPRSKGPSPFRSVPCIGVHYSDCSARQMVWRETPKARATADWDWPLRRSSRAAAVCSGVKALGRPG